MSRVWFFFSFLHVNLYFYNFMYKLSTQNKIVIDIAWAGCIFRRCTFLPNDVCSFSHFIHFLFSGHGIRVDCACSFVNTFQETFESLSLANCHVLMCDIEWLQTHFIGFFESYQLTADFVNANSEYDTPFWKHIEVPKFYERIKLTNRIFGQQSTAIL